MAENIYNPEFVQQLFNKMSGSYERVNYITSFGFSIRWRIGFLKKIAPTKNKIEVIDLLTGMGETWKSVYNHFPNAKLTALDFSAEMLKNATRKNELHFKSEVIITQQDVLQSNLLSNYYDVVICSFGLKTFNDEQIEALAKETKRILKSGGHFSFVEISKPDNKPLRVLYGFYIGRIIPTFGKILLGDPTEYRMLWRYTDKFVNARKATEIFNSVGLKAKYNTYFYGCASGFDGSKP